MRAVIYLRVSTDKQDTDAQLRACKAYCVINNIDQIGPDQDDGFGGAAKLEKRLSLATAIGELRQGDVLLVSRRDRLAREDLIRATIIDMVEKKGAKVVSAAGEGNEDPLDPTTYLARSIADMMATHERLLIKVRTSGGLQAKIAHGESVGAVRYGYDPIVTDRLTKKGKKLVRLVENPAEQAVIRQMREWRAAGLGYRAIAKRLSEQGAATKSGK